MANGHHYSSSPLGDLKHNPLGPAQQTHEAPPSLQPPKKRRQKRYRVLQMILVVVMPVFFLCALLIANKILRLSFIGAAVICMALMWLLKAFSSNARKTLTLVYSVLAVVVCCALLLALNPKQAATKVDAKSMFNTGTALDSDTISNVEKQSATETPAPQATEAPISAAEQRLKLFIEAWTNSDTNTMLTLCLPSWIESQDSAATSLFKLLAIGINKPTSYKVEEVYGSDADATRAIQVVVHLSTSGGDVARRYQIFLNRVNDVWYIDPASLNSISVVTDEDEVFGQQESILTNQTPTPEPDPTVDPNTVLYYNPDGGQAYHCDPNCSSTDAKYLPFKGTFTYSQLNDTPYDVLNWCRYCKPPKRE